MAPAKPTATAPTGTPDASTSCGGFPQPEMNLSEPFSIASFSSPSKHTLITLEARKVDIGSDLSAYCHSWQSTGSGDFENSYFGWILSEWDL
jgi:hypothetical protein